MRAASGALLEDEDGFTLIEVVVACLLAVLILVATLSLADAQASAARVQPALTDAVQRARAALDLVRRDLLAAGAASDLERRTGTFLGAVAPIEPRRIGLLHADPSGSARADAISITYAPVGSVAGELAADFVGPAPVLTLKPTPSCPAHLVACGWPDGSSVVVFDRLERFDYYILSAPPGGPAVLTARQPSAGHSFAAGASLSPVETHTYYFDGPQRQLRHYDGFHSDVPVIDNVVSAAFRYAADPLPPVQPRPPVGQANCLYDASGQPWPIGASPGPRLVDLPLSAIGDGPWCGSGDNRFDLDLLRIRRVHLSLRLQAIDDVRMIGGMFLRPGSSVSARRAVPDVHLTLDVAPRNLNAGR